MTLLAALLNGAPVLNLERAVSPSDRGLQYGDGLFETMLLRDGTMQAMEDHLLRLSSGCQRLAIAMPSHHQIEDEVAALTEGTRHGVVKLILSRGTGGRGYRSDSSLVPSRILTLHEHSPELGPVTVAVRWCTTRIARSPALAGLKHLNRLEQVLAQNEWHDPAIAEGLMMDMEGEIIGGTMSNVFAVSEGVLCTPDLRFSGVRGVMRDRVLRAAHQMGIAAEERALWPDELTGTTEIFITNAVRGIRPVVALDGCRWVIGATTRSLAAALELW